MISKTVFSSDKFTDMTPQARLLYTYMILYSDDQGFTNGVKRLVWEAGASQTDLQTLIDKGYVIHFESGAYLIAHWLLMNKVPPSKASETPFSKELNSVFLNEDKVYTSYKNDEEQAQEIRKQIETDLIKVSQQDSGQ